MKSTGIVRRIDDLGRVVIPKEIRRVIGIREGEPLEIYVDAANRAISFVKYQDDRITSIANGIYEGLAKLCIEFAIYGADGAFVKGVGTWDNFVDNIAEPDERTFPILNSSDEPIGFILTDGAPRPLEKLFIEMALTVAKGML